MAWAPKSCWAGQGKLIRESLLLSKLTAHNFSTRPSEEIKLADLKSENISHSKSASFISSEGLFVKLCHKEEIST